MHLKYSSENIIPASAAILVGGKSSRFGSDKVFMKFDYISVSELLHSLFTELFSEVFFVSNEEKNILKNQKLHIDLFTDKGPLGGLYTALKNSGNEYCFVAACDTPFINKELIKFLWHSRDNADAVVPVWNDKSEPLAAIYNVRCTEIIERQIESGKLSLKNFIEQLNIRKVNVSEIFSEPELEKLFFNINSPQNFELAKRIWLKSN